MKKLKLKIDKKFKSKEYLQAIYIINKLHNNNFKAYLVGGCVRDIYLNLKPKDFDIVTDAKPNQIKSIFKNVIPVGEQFGIIIVYIDGIETEVATFRKESGYIDGRHPTKIEFTTEKEDVTRRDFTTNALLYDIKTETIIDYINGIEDINNGIIKAIGNADDRFKDDKLRMLRAIRFASRFNFKIENETYIAIKKYTNLITVVSSERIREELTKIFIGPNNVQALEMLYETKLMKYIIPEAYKYKGMQQPPEFHPEGDVYEHVKIMLKYSKNEKPNNKLFNWAIFLHDIGKPATYFFSDRIRFNNHDFIGAKIAAKICKRLKFSKKDTDYIVSLTNEHMRFISLPQMRLSTKKKLFRKQYISDLILLLKLDILGSFGDLSLYNQVVEEYDILKNEKLKPQPLLMGKDLIELGYTPSPIFSKILSKLEDLQLENKITTKEDAIKFVTNNFLINKEH